MGLDAGVACEESAVDKFQALQVRQQGGGVEDGRKGGDAALYKRQALHGGQSAEEALERKLVNCTGELMVHDEKRLKSGTASDQGQSLW